jgi:hypothetical protein
MKKSNEVSNPEIRLKGERNNIQRGVGNERATMGK